MNRTTFALAATLLAGAAFAPALVAQTSSTTPASPIPASPTPGNSAPGATSNSPMPGVSTSTGTTPRTGVVDRNTGTAAAAGDRNQAVATTGNNAPQPARGANSFTQAEARRRLERNGFQQVTGLKKDTGGVWRGMAMKDGQSSQVWLDYKGNAGLTNATPASATMPGSSTAAPGTSSNANPGANPPGTAATRSMDRTLGTNTTGANPAANAPDGTPGNPPGTAAGRAVDKTVGTNTTGANPNRSSVVNPR